MEILKIVMQEQSDMHTLKDTEVVEEIKHIKREKHIKGRKLEQIDVKNLQRRKTHLKKILSLIIIKY